MTTSLNSQITTKPVKQTYPPQLEIITGSRLYGNFTENSDTDVYSIVIPPIEMVFPHKANIIVGFGTQMKEYKNNTIKFSIHGKEFEYNSYGIVSYFHLAMTANPNIIDSLFAPDDKVLSETSIGKKIRENKNLFLSKRVVPRFFGYANSQIKKMKYRNYIGKRSDLKKEYGYDIKNASHLIRLMLELKQLLKYQDIMFSDNSEIINKVRTGEYLISDVLNMSDELENEIKELINESTLRDNPDEESLKKLLMKCLEEYYGEKL